MATQELSIFDIDICDPDTLSTGAKCLKLLNSRERLAALVYLMALELKYIGGKDYTDALTTTLATDSVCFRNLTLDQTGKLKVGTAYLVIQAYNAILAGATLSDSVDDLKVEIKCLVNEPEATLMAMWVYLLCLLKQHASQLR